MEDNTAYTINVTKDCNIAETVEWAATEGKPLDVTLDNGRTVRLVPQSGT